MTTLQRAQILGVLGVLGSLFWLGLNTLLSPDWGPPGSARYLGYEAVNRLWSLGFAGMLCGYAGLYQRYALRGSRPGRVGFRLAAIGLVLMMAGNVAEFWLFSEQAYGEINGRNLAWIGVLLGMLAALIGAGLMGAAGLRQRQQLLPRWSALLFLSALPATIILILTAVALMGLPLVIASVAAGALAAWPGTAALAAQEAS